MHFSIRSKKLKKSATEKLNFPTLISKNFYIFSKESFSYILGNWNPKKISYIFLKAFLIFQETKRNILIFQEVTFQAQKMKKIHS